MRLDVRLAVVSQAHEARLDGLVASADAEVAQRLPLEVGKGRELGEMSPLLGDVGDVASEHGPWGEGGPALGAAVHPDVVALVPVDLDALQAVGK